jgi:hypothetical protein
MFFAASGGEFNPKRLKQQASMKLAIVGALCQDDYHKTRERLDFRFPALSEVTKFVSSGDQGAGGFAERLAENLGKPIKEFLPNYKRYGRAAPLVRNTQLVEYADYIIVFIDEYSRGTYDFIKKAKAANKPLTVIYLNDEEDVLRSWVREGLCPKGCESSKESARINGDVENHCPHPNYRLTILKRGLGYRHSEGGYFHYRKDAERIKQYLEQVLSPDKIIIELLTLEEKDYIF